MKRLFSFFRHLLVPNPANGYRSKALHHDFLSFYIIVAFIFALVIKTQSVSATNVLGFATDITINKLFELTNAERSKYNLNTLSYNQKLQDAAYKKAQDMFARNYWAHYGPDSETPWDFIVSSGYSYEFAGENLAKNFLFSQNVTDAWMNSETHKENILRKDFTEIGFAVVNGVLNGEQTTLVVQMFGKPSGSQLAQTQPYQKYQPEVRSSVNKIQTPNKKQVLNLQIPLNIIYLFIVFLIAVFAIDYYVGSKLGLTRIHGKHIAHFVFLSSVVVGAFFFLSKGAIL